MMWRMGSWDKRRQLKLLFGWQRCTGCSLLGAVALCVSVSFVFERGLAKKIQYRISTDLMCVHPGSELVTVTRVESGTRPKKE